MIEVLSQVRADEYRQLWGRVPSSVGAVGLILAVGLLGWDRGFPLGILILVALTLICKFVPSYYWIVQRVVDAAFVTVMNATVMRVLWVALAADLWIIQNRGPWSVALVLLLVLLNMALPFMLRYAYGRLIETPRRNLAL